MKNLAARQETKTTKFPLRSHNSRHEDGEAVSWPPTPQRPYLICRFARIIWTMRTRILGPAALILTSLVGYACSAGPNSEKDKGTTQGGDNVSVDGSGGSGEINPLDPNNPGTGTGGIVDTGPVVLPVAPPCKADGTCDDGSICTVSNNCGVVSIDPATGMPISCQNHDQCQSDTYCCDADCAKNADEAGVCIPGNAGPGNADSCKGEIQIGVFSPAVQCEWKANDAFGGNVAVTPLVADLPNDSGESAEIVFTSFAGDDSNAASKNVPGTLRIIRGDNCQLLETIEGSKGIVRANTTPALADLDGDGNIEIVSYKKDSGLIAFKWNGTSYDKYWENNTPSIGASQVWSGVAIHDLGTGVPSIIVGSGDKVYTFNGKTGAEIGSAITASAGGSTFNGFIPVIGDFDNDGVPSLLTSTGNSLYAVNWEGNGWGKADASSQIKFNAGAIAHFAFADFGTESADGNSFDETKLDGIAEIVTTEDQATARVGVFTLKGQTLMNIKTDLVNPPTGAGAPTRESGGPPVIGDFDKDGFPEIGVAGATRFRVFDLGCKGAPAGCESDFVRWSTASQDASSRQTGASVFDFDGDGKAEAIYADECFLRVYEGDTGKVLFSSYRTSGTWYENPVVADVDKDQNTEIVVNSAYEVKCPAGGASGTPYVDPLHPGVGCDDNDSSSCGQGSRCVDSYCRCTGNDQCGSGLTCLPALTGGDNTCRATHPNDANSVGGIKVLRDRLDRWTSSRAIWNQHAYSVTNINEDGSVPNMSSWEQNFTNTEYNHYRQNAQGDAAPDDLPDVTGKLDTADLCKQVNDKLFLTGRICNRGNKAVGAALPATFYDANGNILCVSYTQTPVKGNGDCRLVSCEVNLETVSGSVKMVVNDDGMGGRTTVECRENNNSDTVLLEEGLCVVVK